MLEDPEKIIYIGQTDITFTINVKDLATDTAKDITGHTSVVVGYKTPSGNKGQLPVTVVNAAAGLVTFQNLTINPFDEIGTFYIWLRIVNADGSTTITSPAEIYVKQPGDTD